MVKKSYQEEWRDLGTDIFVQLVVENDYDKKRADEIFSQIKEIYATQAKIFSRFDAESELSRINSHLGEWMEVSPDMLKLAQTVQTYFQESQGIFDPRILDTLEKSGYRKNFRENDFSGEWEMVADEQKSALQDELMIDSGRIKFLSRMDFSGLAKGYITDKVVDFLRQEGLESFLVGSGGDMFAGGKDEKGNEWGIGLEESRIENEILVTISDMAVATSGNVRRQWKRGEKKVHHLVHPQKMNEFTFDLKSVTVVEKTVERSDALAKILFLQGLEKGLETAREKKIRAYFLKADGEIVSSM